MATAPLISFMCTLVPNDAPSTRSGPTVRDPFRLAERPLERVWVKHLHLHGHPDSVLDEPRELSGHHPSGLGADRLVRLDLDGELVEVARAGEHAQVVRREAFDLEDLLLHLRREHVHTAHD